MPFRINWTLIALPIFIFAACSKEEKASAPLCEMPAPGFSIQTSATPSQFDLELDQQKLGKMMSLSLQDAQCFSTHQRLLELYNVPTPSPGRKTFSSLPPIPAHLHENWSKAMAKSHNSLLGLTTTQSTVADDSLVKVYITMKDTARIWHLWHEFAHYLVKLELFNKQRFYIPPKKTDIDALQRDFAQALLYVKSDPERNFDFFLQKLKELTGTFELFARTEYIEEFMIEATMIDLLYLNRVDLEAGPRNLKESIRFIKYSSQEYKNFYNSLIQILTSLLPKIKRHLTDQQTQILESIIERSTEKMTNLRHLEYKTVQQALELQHLEPSVQCLEDQRCL